ncbi:MAG: sigma-54 dependent transcriptional regulator [Oligoflexia bacterium]|nr:sigma-54 dependent transcriptional regulator [Oligoflexia bacterium]
MVEGRKRVLIVDDEVAIRDSLRLLLERNFEVNTATDGEAALGVVESFKPDLILLDLLMPKLDGLETLKRLREREEGTPVIMLTASNTVKDAVQAMKMGAIDYLSKPFDVESLTTLIIETLDRDPAPAAEEKNSTRQGLITPEADFGPMVGKAQCMQELFRKIKQVAERDTTVLITGESGTGKELVAKQIHALSARRDKPFIAINCAAIPETLIESELFGHEKGAFTNAVDKRIGHFELADGGTLFLDEIGELSLNVQVKMLRFLQEQEFYRVGRSKPVKVDVRVITATNKTLEDLIKEKKFRQDLFYRINVINLKIPALRDRFEDIPHMISHFCTKFAPLYGGRKIEFTEAALDTCVAYDWPGNARELENVVESIIALCPNDLIQDEDLPRKLKERSATPENFRTQVFASNMKFEEAERVFETEMIVKALKKTNFVQTKAAELLGISRRILKYKMDKLGISEDPAVPVPPSEEPQKVQ